MADARAARHRGIPVPDLFGYALDAPRDYYLLSLVVLVICGGLVLVLQRSHLGRAWRAIREDEIGAQAFGVPLAGYKALVFALGGIIAGLGGSLLAHQYGYLHPDLFDVSVSILALTIVVLGGMANVYGPSWARSSWSARPNSSAPCRTCGCWGTVYSCCCWSASGRRACSAAADDES